MNFFSQKEVHSFQEANSGAVNLHEIYPSESGSNPILDHLKEKKSKFETHLCLCKKDENALVT